MKPLRHMKFWRELASGVLVHPHRLKLAVRRPCLHLSYWLDRSGISIEFLEWA